MVKEKEQEKEAKEKELEEKQKREQEEKERKEKEKEENKKEAAMLTQYEQVISFNHCNRFIMIHTTLLFKFCG